MSNDELKGLMKRILDDAFVMSLGTQDEGGVWVSDVIYVCDESHTLYWASSPQVRHSKAIDEDGTVACTITASWTPNDERALQIEGRAERMEGDFPELAVKLNAKCGKDMPERIESMLASGRVWYRMIPTKIEMHHSKPFGYEKQTITL